MNSLKNLMIMAVLAAVGYGVYASLSRNNMDSDPSGDGWPAAKVDMSGLKMPKSSGGPLALSGSRRPASTLTNPDKSVLTPPPLPPLAPLSGAGSGRAPALGSVDPYPSSNAPSAPPVPSFSSPGVRPGAELSPPAPSPSDVPPLPSQSPGPPPGGSALPSDTVHNLAPPPDATPTPPPPSANPAPPPAAPPEPRPGDGVLQAKFAAYLEAVQAKLDEGKYAEAQLSLSMWYFNPDLPAEQIQQITELLDQLAGTVIYSRQNYLEPAYTTRPGDTLETVAQQYSIPWQLLAKINGLLPPNAVNAEDAAKSQPLPLGMTLKVIHGPFDAVIRLDKRELTLKVQNRYAGRFPIGLGRDLPKMEGEFTVRSKTLSPTYYGPNGTPIDPNDPRNPLGGAWIELSDRVGIHGTPDPKAVGRDDNPGSICTRERDLQDLYGILSVGSRVTILR